MYSIIDINKWKPFILPSKEKLERREGIEKQRDAYDTLIWLVNKGILTPDMTLSKTLDQLRKV